MDHHFLGKCEHMVRLTAVFSEGPRSAKECETVGGEGEATSMGKALRRVLPEKGEKRYNKYRYSQKVIPFL